MAHEKIEAVYTEIANKIVEMIPFEWSKLLLFSEVEEGANSIHYVIYEKETQELKESESLINEYGISRKEEMKQSVQLSRLITKLSKAFEDEGLEKWNLMTFILENTGKFKIDFEYVILEDSDVITRREAWEKKYL
jgi:hypothetical protein